MKGFSFESNCVIKVFKKELKDPNFEVEELDKIDGEVIDFIAENGWNVFSEEFENFCKENQDKSIILLSGIHELILVIKE